MLNFKKKKVCLAKSKAASYKVPEGLPTTNWLVGFEGILCSSAPHFQLATTREINYLSLAV